MLRGPEPADGDLTISVPARELKRLDPAKAEGQSVQPMQRLLGQLVDAGATLQ